MTANDLIGTLEFEFYGILAATPDWDTSLWDFLIERGVEPDDIWTYSKQIGWDAGQDEPDWL